MEIIKFKIGNLYDVLEDNYDLISENKDYYDTEEQDGNMFVVTNYRLVIPMLHISLREADWYAYCPEADEDDGWEVQDSVYLLYEENEKDINKWISSCTKTIDYSLIDVCEKEGIPVSEIDDLEGYIEFD